MDIYIHTQSHTHTHTHTHMYIYIDKVSNRAILFFLPDSHILICGRLYEYHCPYFDLRTPRAIFKKGYFQKGIRKSEYRYGQ